MIIVMELLLLSKQLGWKRFVDRETPAWLQLLPLQCLHVFLHIHHQNVNRHWSMTSAETSMKAETSHSITYCGSALNRVHICGLNDKQILPPGG